MGRFSQRLPAAPSVALQPAPPSEMAHPAASCVITQGAMLSVMGQSAASSKTRPSVMTSVARQSTAPPVIRQSPAPSVMGHSEVASVAGQSATPSIVSQSTAPSFECQFAVALQSPQAAAAPPLTSEASCHGLPGAAFPLLHRVSKPSSSLPQPCAPHVRLSSFSRPSAVGSKLAVSSFSPLCCMSFSRSEMAASPLSSYIGRSLSAAPRPLATTLGMSLPSQSPQSAALFLLLGASAPLPELRTLSSGVAVNISSDSGLKGRQSSVQVPQQISPVPAPVSHDPVAHSCISPDFSPPSPFCIRCLTPVSPPSLDCRGREDSSAQGEEMTAARVPTPRQTANHAAAFPSFPAFYPAASSLLTGATADTVPAAATHAAVETLAAIAPAANTSVAAASAAAIDRAATDPPAGTSTAAGLPPAAASRAAASLPAAVPAVAIAAGCGPSLREVASSRHLPTPYLPRSLPSCANPAELRKTRKGRTLTQLLPGATSVPPGATAPFRTQAAAAATLTKQMSTAPEGTTEIEVTAAEVLRMVPVTDTTSAADVGTATAAKSATTARAATADRRREGYGIVRTTSRPWRPSRDHFSSATGLASTARGVLLSERKPRERRVSGGRVGALRREGEIAAECMLGVFKATAAAATSAPAAGRGTRGDGMTTAAATAARAAIAAAAGATAARLLAMTRCWGAAAAIEGRRAAGLGAGGSTRDWGRGRNSEDVSPVGLLTLFPFSFSPWGVLFGVVVVAVFHVCLFWGASWFFSKHLFREYQQKRLSVQHLFAFTFTVCVAMLQLLLLELLHVLHPTLRRWVWHGDLVCVLLLLYLVLPVSIVYNLVVRSSPPSTPAAKAAPPAASFSYTGVPLGDMEGEPDEEEAEKAETAAEKMSMSTAAGAEVGGGWDAATAAQLGYAATTAQQRGRRKRGDSCREWEASAYSGGMESFTGTTADTATACDAEQQQQGRTAHPIVMLGASVMRWWGCGRRRCCKSSIHVKERLLERVQHRIDEEEDEPNGASVILHGDDEQITSLLPDAVSTAVAVPGLGEDHYSAERSRRIFECAPAAACHPDEPVTSHSLVVEVMATSAATRRAVSPSAAATAATRHTNVAQQADGAPGSAEACLSPSCAVLNARRMSSALLARRAQELPRPPHRWGVKQTSGDSGSLQQQGVQQQTEGWNKQEERLQMCGGRQQEVQEEAAGERHLSAKEQQSTYSRNCRQEHAAGGKERLLSPAALLSLRIAMARDGLSSPQDSGANCSSRNSNVRSRMLCLVFAICCVMLPLLWMCFYQSGRLLHLDPAAVASLSFMECLLAYVGICGVTVVSALAGFGSVNFPYRILFASFSKISQSQVEELEQRLLHTLSLIAEKKKKTQKLQQAACARKTAARCCLWLAPSSSCCLKDSSRRAAAVGTTHLHECRAAAAAAMRGEELHPQYHRIVQQDHQRTNGSCSTSSSSSSSSISVHPQQKLLRQQQVLEPPIAKHEDERSESVALAWTEGSWPGSSFGRKLRKETLTAGRDAAATGLAAVAIRRQQDWDRRIDEAPLGEEPGWYSATAAGLLIAKEHAPGVGLQQSQSLQVESEQQRQHLLQEHRQAGSGVGCASAEEETGTATGNSGFTFFSRLLKRGGRGCAYTHLAPQQVMSEERDEQQQMRLHTGATPASPFEENTASDAAGNALSQPTPQRRNGDSSTWRTDGGLAGGRGPRNSSREGFHTSAGRMEGIGSGSSKTFSSSEDETGRQTSMELTPDEEKNALSLMERGYACSRSSRNKDNSSRLGADPDNYCSSWNLSRRWKESIGGKWRSNNTRKNNNRRREGLRINNIVSRRNDRQEGAGAVDWLQPWRGLFAEEVAVPREGRQKAAMAVNCEIESLAAAEAGMSVRRGGKWSVAAGDRQVRERSFRERGKRWQESASTSASAGTVCSGRGAPAGWLPSRVWAWACGVLQQQPHGQQWLWTGMGDTSSRVKGREEEGEAQHHLQSEITALEELSRELFVALDNLVQSRAQALYRETVVGRLHSLLAWVMTGVCIFRVGSAGVNVLCGRSSAGVGAAGAAAVPQADPATRAVEAVLQQLQVPVNVAAVSPYLSLLLLSCIIALTIRNFVEKLLTVFRHISTSSVWAANVLALVMAEIMGFYFSACVLLTRVYLPPAYQDAVTQILAPSLDFRVFHLHFDRVFLVSCLVSFAVILFSHKHVTEKFKSL